MNRSIDNMNRNIDNMNDMRSFDNQQGLPVIVIISLGGTMMGKGCSPTDTSNYKSGVFDIKDVIKTVKHSWEQDAIIETHSPFSIDSIDLDLKHKITLYQTVTGHISRPEVIGVLIASGTDEMPETAQYLDVTIPNGPDKRITFTGAHKPHTAPGAEGPSQVLAGVKTLLDRKWTGVTILSIDKLMRPFGTKKIEGRFEPGPDTLLAEIRDFEPKFWRLEPNVKRMPRRLPKHVDISGLSSMEVPDVFVIPVQPGCSDSQFQNAVQNGARGIILEGYSSGWWPNTSKDSLAESAKRDDLVVVMVSRHCSATVYTAGVEGAIPGGNWNRDQLLPILQTVIQLGWSKERIKDLCLYPFESIES